MNSFKKKLFLSYLGLFVFFLVFFFQFEEAINSLKFGFFFFGIVMFLAYSLVSLLVIDLVSRPIQRIVKAIAPFQEGKETFLPKIEIDKVIEINISDIEAIKRLRGRWNCKKCGIGYNIVTAPKPKQEKICDICKSELYQRNDDTKEVIKSRLQVYNNDTKPLIDYYQKSNVLKDIDSNGSKEIVLEILLKNINQKDHGKI